MIKLLLILIIILNCDLQLFSQEISLEDVEDYVGKPDTVKVCGKIFSARFLATAKRKPTLLNVGDLFPNQKLTVVIFEEDKGKFSPKPEVYFLNKQVCISGVIIDYDGKPEIVVRNSNQIEISARDFIVRDISPKQKSRKLNNETNVWVTITQANLRSGPSSDFSIITTVPSGSAVTVINSNNGWSRVEVKVPSENNSRTLSGYLTNAVLK